LLVATVNLEGTKVKVNHAWLAPAARYNLSVGQMAEDKDWMFVLDKRECQTYDAQSRELIRRTPKRGRLYKLSRSMTKRATLEVIGNGRTKQEGDAIEFGMRGPPQVGRFWPRWGREMMVS